MDDDDDGVEGQLQPVHHHPLRFREGRFYCALCIPYEAVHGYHYHCPTCNVGFHKDCAEYPPKIIHPYHHMDDYSDKREWLLPGHHHPLRGTRGSFCCALCNPFEVRDLHYYCPTCNVRFHIDCAEYPPKIIHPYHPTHPLTFHLNRYPRYTGKCSLCHEVIEEYRAFYRCSICDFSVHLRCEDHVRPLIDHPECHEHKLAFQPEQQNISFTCHVCGLTHSDDMCRYKCVESECDFKVHEDCIYLPRDIKITCHEHRLSRVDPLPSEGWSCEICHGGFDDHKYRAYVCDEGCSYAIHLRCATREGVWDENPKNPAMDPMLPPIHPHALSLKSGCVTSCGVCHQTNKTDVSYFYYCWSCKVEFHRGCVEPSPAEIKHPFHPHPLRLGFGRPISCEACSHSYTADMHNHYYCGFCYVQFHAECAEVFPEVKHPFHPNHPLTPIMSMSPDYFNKKCHPCGKGLKGFFYQCSACDFYVDMFCVKKPPPLDIDHVKSHAHRLTLLPRLMISFTCNACGLLGDRYPYVCCQCDFMVHRDCVDLPRVIKIARHHHRLSYTSFRLPGKWSCGVCRQEVDGRYGEYSCNEGCPYVTHSKCATRDDVWDGKELEGKPDERDETKESFKVINVGIINHCSHEHDLRLNKDSSLCDKDKHCEACILPMLSDPFYSCVRMDCHFFLHEKCAHLPRKIHHILHRHPLTLDIDHMQSESLNRFAFACTACDQFSSGFKYTCLDWRCDFTLDAQCASVSEPFTHKGHEHPLFFPLFDNKGKGCCGCGEESSYMLNCVECDFVLDFKCATLPSVVKYKYDEHLLKICSSSGEANGQHWCEICEEEIDPNKWFYSCDDCGVISHIECTLEAGTFRIFKRGQRFNVGSDDDRLEVVSNHHIPRPLCKKCHCRCLDTIAWKMGDDYVCFKCFGGPQFRKLMEERFR